MSVSTALSATLGPLVSSRAYPTIFPQPPALPVWPAIRYTIVSNVPDVMLCGDTGDEGAQTSVQIDVVAQTYSGAQSVREQVLAAMRSFVYPAILTVDQALWDDETKTHRLILSYDIHRSTTP